MAAVVKVTIEGARRSGKTTLAALLARAISQELPEVILQVDCGDGITQRDFALRAVSAEESLGKGYDDNGGLEVHIVEKTAS